MTVYMAQAKIKAEHVTELQAAADKMFAAVEAVQPEGIRYAWALLDDGDTFVALVQADEGVENPIPGLPEYQELQARMAGSLASAPTRQQLTVVGSYRLF